MLLHGGEIVSGLSHLDLVTWQLLTAASVTLPVVKLGYKSNQMAQEPQDLTLFYQPSLDL